MLQHLIPKVVHQFADALVARALVAWEARAALAIDEAHDDALRQGEGVPIGAEITHFLASFLHCRLHIQVEPIRD